MKRNFPDARILQVDVTDLIQDGAFGSVSFPIDFLHFSPPCQPYCRLANINPKPEDPRKDLLLSCRELMKKYRNRVVTLEQTSHLLDSKHEEYFNTLINGFTSLGFSIRWLVHP